MLNVIKQDDTVKNNIINIAKDNDDAIDTMLDVLDEVENEDFINFLIKLDIKRVYGKDIWVGYNDVCEKDAAKFYDAVINEKKFMFDYIRRNGNDNAE